MKWQNLAAILLWALSGAFFIISALNNNNSGKESGGIKAVGTNGEVFLLDTLLGRQEIGLLVNGVDLQSNNKGDGAEAAQSSRQGVPCVNINSATEEQFLSLKGVGPVMASRIVEYRIQKGRFRKKEDLLNVKGIGPAKFNKMVDQICF
ncbi:MAG: helix-hairpin-helix domain-containing protein [Chitinispirillales bacterium]|nr:helix-hairpin-helix domain-containing protein [Chitinispirillales bacterium]